MVSARADRVVVGLVIGVPVMVVMVSSSVCWLDSLLDSFGQLLWTVATAT